MFPESGHSTPLSTSFTDSQFKAESPVLGKKGKISSSPKRPQPIGASAPTAAPRKSKPKVRGLSILRSALEVPLEVKLLTSIKKPKATSTPQNLVVWYNLLSCHLGRHPTGSIKMKELKSSPDSPIEERKPPPVKMFSSGSSRKCHRENFFLFGFQNFYCISIFSLTLINPEYPLPNIL